MDTQKMAGLIAELRKKQKMTQKQLAEKLGVTDKAVSKWERGAGCPDISILPSLSEVLGISVGELLGGEKAAETTPETEMMIETTLRYADIASKSRSLTARNMISKLISCTALLGIAVCTICNIAIQGSFTWSLYPIISIIFAWTITIPLFLFPRKGLPLSLGLLSVLIIPFLITLGILSGSKEAMLSIGTKISLVGILYLWVIYILFWKMKHKKLMAAAISMLLGIPAAWVINFIVDSFIHSNAIDVWDIIAYAILTFVSLVFFFIGGKRRA